MKTILITGTAGFIGRYVSRYFFDQGWIVVGIDNSPPENAPISTLSVYHRMQLPSPELSDLIQTVNPDVFIHCAGRASVGLSVTDPSADFQANTVLTFELLNTLRIFTPHCRFIFLSSAAVYGNPETLPITEQQMPVPISPYGFHKLFCEQICLEFSRIYNLPTASVRIFSAYGPGLRRQVLWDICQKVITQDIVALHGTGQESRDFIHAVDIARALGVIANNAPMQGEVYNLGTGEEVSISSLANTILKVFNYENEVSFNGLNLEGYPLNWRADISRLNELGFVPEVPFLKGVETFSYWCRAELIGV
jgi:UDP-glucose 4-epimerase